VEEGEPGEHWEGWMGGVRVGAHEDVGSEVGLRGFEVQAWVQARVQCGGFTRVGGRGGGGDGEAEVDFLGGGEELAGQACLDRDCALEDGGAWVNCYIFSMWEEAAGVPG